MSATAGVDEVAERVAEGDGEVGAGFARAYLRRIGVQTLDAGIDALAAEVRGAFALLSDRGDAPSAVRAFTPVQSEHGYEPGRSVVETNTDDLPFLVDSVTGVIRSRGHSIARVVHPIVGTERDASGRLVAVGHPRDMPRRESVMHFQLGERLSPEQLAALEDEVRDVLATVRRVVEDFPAVLERLDAAMTSAQEAEDEDASEVAAFLRWLREGQFVFLGARIEDGGDAALGLLADQRCASLMPQDPPADGAIVAVSKADVVSPVHRRERMDVVAVRVPGGVVRLIGLFTSRAYSEPASHTPLLSSKLRRILAAEDLVEGSHDWKAAVALFDTFPKDELFAASAEDLRQAIVALLALHGDEVRLLARRAQDGRGAALIATLPRGRYSAGLRAALRDLVAERLGAEDVHVHEVLGEADRVQLHLGVHAPGGLQEFDTGALEDELRTLARTWVDRLAEALVADHGAERGRMFASRWAPRLPEPYRAAVDPAVGADDVRRLEDLHTGARDLLVGLHDEQGADGPRTRVALYVRGPKIELSRATPMLEHLGLRVIEEQPTRLLGEGETWVQAFAVLGPGDTPLDLADCGARVAATLEAVWRGEADSDSLHRLVVTGGLDHHQVDVLRALRRYRQRIGSRYTEGFQNDVICAHADVTAKQVRLFELRFGADGTDKPRDEAAEQALRDEILEDLDNIELLDHDRIMRNQLGVMDAIVRTTAYRPDRDALAFKLRSREVPAIPHPAPLFEVYVYGRSMEGVHLRGGRIARGGLRLSDRMDYRTEVDGLVRAQMTKNAIIVPTGAKGGFFLHERPDDADALRAEIKRQYVRYVSALLDLTDNLRDGEVVHPSGVRVLDGEDTYLVVAADKGTATMSDTANEVAESRGFWLGDAFASGGSTGYDHKALGITARGAWEAVKRHFRELGVDPEADVITAVGIGDMSGDVFGNGMLLSQTLELVAAYDHRHIFLDPDPDPERSFQERKRLFALPGSCWADYDPDVLSEGAQVVPRSAKRVALTPQVRARLGIEAEELPPNDVIRAILRAPVDLLWNGGIGTVVKASAESDADARDRSSDAIRIDARELRCRVVGEGGNLGFTQRARIEASRHGVLCHADFIDNSAGVDISDHEVNLKVLLNLAVARGELDRPGRDALLSQVTEDVVAHVLRDSYQQAQILAQEVSASSTMLWAYDDLMLDAELERDVEFLPEPEELAERRRAGTGLERPELSVLVAYAKQRLADRLLESDLPDEPWIADAELRAYFPKAVVERFGHLLGEHPLKREIVATRVAGDVVDSLGPTFVSRLVAERGATPDDVVGAYRIARHACEAPARWEAIEALDAALEREVYWRLMGGVDAMVADATRWWLAHPEDDAGAAAERARVGFAALEDAMRGMRDEDWAARADRCIQELVEAGVPQDVADRHALAPALVHACDAIAVSRDAGRDVLESGRALAALGESVGLEWLEREIDALPAQTRLSRWAQHAVRDDVLETRAALARRALEESPDAPPDEAVIAFLESRAGPLMRLQAFTRALALDDGQTDLAAVTLAVRHLRALA